MRQYQVVIYGSYGYTGRLIAEECKARNLTVLLSGRDSQKLVQQSTDTGFPHATVEVTDRLSLVEVLRQGSVLIHCGGPFWQTAEAMVEACLEAQTHYTDITGEYLVFELLSKYDSRARAKGIVVMPGVGFDVVPSDCLALHLKNLLPTATYLQLAFAMSKGGLSRGTAKTMVEGLGHGSIIRSANKLIPVPLGKRSLKVDFGGFSSRAMNIPWGDVSTAWRSTGIPNIEVYTAVSPSMITGVRIARHLNWLLQKRWIKDRLLKRIDKGPAGPSGNALRQSRSYLWGKVWDRDGTAVEARLETPGGYLLTAKTATHIAEKILKHATAGYYTPAQLFGERLILEVAGTTLTDISSTDSE